MPTERGRPHRTSPRRQLLLDVAVVTMLLLLDVRDLWFKLRWVGSRDAFAFSTTKSLYLPSAPTASPLESTVKFTYAEQKSQRISGWTSFLQKCGSLTPLPEVDADQGFRYVLGKNCVVGAESSALRVHDLILTSSVRVDSMAWAACELLYKHRKPPICHSPIVTRFRERYGIYNVQSFDDEASTRGPISMKSAFREVKFVDPGSEVEADLVNVLSVISRSSPISSVVCVEGFVLKGPGLYTSTVYGCGSPSFYLSAFVGSDAMGFAKLQRDKGWLTSDTLRVMGMTFLVRENRRSEFSVHHAGTDPSGGKTLEHESLINFSASGSLYSIMILMDLILLLLNACSIVEISRRVLWPLWKPLIVTEYQISSARTTKLGYALEDYSRVLRVCLLRSTPVAIVIVISRILSWILIIPSAIVWTDSKLDSSDLHAFLTMIRVSDLVLLSVNALWNLAVACDEIRALAFVRRTYVKSLEVVIISAGVALCCLPPLMSQLFDERRLYEHQRIIDSASIANYTAFANAFPAQQDTIVNTPSVSISAIYSPLLIIGGVSIFIVAALVTLRFVIGQSSLSQKMVQSPRVAAKPSQSTTTEKLPAALVKNIEDKLASTDDILQPASPLPSPTHDEPGTAAPAVSAALLAPPAQDERLPIEDSLDIPIRARSLVRDLWALEKVSGEQRLLLPQYYLEHGIVLEGRSMRTRCGFVDVVQPLVHAEEHEMPKREEDIKLRGVSR